jgi:hypothetical protein
LARCRFADDEEYSVIATLDVRAACWVRTLAVWLEWAYFEAALADPPASAPPETSAAVATIASVPIMALYIAISIWLGTTQTEQTWTFPNRLLCSASCCPPLTSMISLLPNRKNQSARAGKISIAVDR